MRGGEDESGGEEVVLPGQRIGQADQKGGTPDFAKCSTKSSATFAKAESAAGPGVCPTEGDTAAIEGSIDAGAAAITAALSGVRFIDNGDGTVTDVQTGLQWEKKDDLSGIHDKDNSYQWSSSGTAPDGDAFTVFIGTLNGGTSTDGTTLLVVYYRRRQSDVRLGR